MKSVSISGTIRECVGKKDAKMQRKLNLVPCVVYGVGEQTHILVEEKQFKPIIFTPESLYAELNFGGKTINAIIQETQFHPISEKLLHVDFLEVNENKPITIKIPISLVGTSPGVLRGGKLNKKFRKLKVKGLLKNIPEKIELNISDLDIDQSIKIADIKTENFNIIENKANIVVGVASSRNVTDTPEETK